ncbi:MAG TPA: TolC family protein, partial [Candidatus Omnitrophota bacterium]|nr:TolC family protein [Candidatus Omnitrophota bacterium]
MPNADLSSVFNKEDFIKTADTDKVLTLSMTDCILMALKNNSEIKITGYNPRIRKEDINSAWSDFEPTLDIEYLISDNTQKASSALLGAGVSSSRYIDWNMALSGKLITGTEYNLEFLNERASSNSQFQTINPSYMTEPKISLVQPLLRGFGIAVNKADITIAQNNEKQSKQDWMNTAIDIISKTKNAYYGYSYFRDAYEINKDSLDRAVDLLRINGQRYKKGLLSSV